MSDIREASIEPGNERLPGGILLQAGPFLILAAGAIWLAAIWDRLPARLPVHWNWRGEADRIVARTIPGVALPLVIGGVLCLVQLWIQAGILRGAPRAPLRTSGLKLLLAAEYFVALVCCGGLAVSVTEGRLLAPFVAACLAGVAVILALTWRMLRSAPRAPVRNPSAWHAGVIYADRDDPALFVPKRTGLGYTFNFGHPQAVWMTLALLAIPLLAALLALNAR